MDEQYANHLTITPPMVCGSRDYGSPGSCGANPSIADEIKVEDACEVREISASMEVSPRVPDSAKHVFGDT